MNSARPTSSSSAPNHVPMPRASFHTSTAHLRRSKKRVAALPRSKLSRALKHHSGWSDGRAASVLSVSGCAPGISQLKTTCADMGPEGVSTG